MAEIVLATLNAKYIHASFGLRYLLANLGELRSRAALLEFDINQKPLDVVEILLAQNPQIIGLGVYIWNVSETTEVVAALKKLRPDLTIILGGPEVSFEVEQQEIVRLADYVITGEADLKFAEICARLLRGDKPSQKIIPAELPDLARLALPYDLYTDDDVAHRIIYVEASRGCPFTCEFCLSSLDIPVRQIPLPALLENLEKLLHRGVKQFKFVDRTFNLNLNTSRAILEFFFARMKPGLFIHFEMIPDRLPEALRELIAKFPPGVLQFEVGIQTFDETVSKNISRRQDYTKLADNFNFLREKTGVHLHADLIVGLPGETVESFGAGFDRLTALRPQEIQVGILKRLRGTPIVRHDKTWEMIYSANPPYEILQNKLIDFPTMQKLRRFARYWDLIGNSGNFVESLPLLWSEKVLPTFCRQTNLAADLSQTISSANCANKMSAAPSAFAHFMRLSEWLFEKIGRQHSIALLRLSELFFQFLTEEMALDKREVGEIFWRDWQRAGRSEKPIFLREFIFEPA
ncbi:MAG: DUF4080 domain-containing protein, partial [Verrucomicrobiota bacterium]